MSDISNGRSPMNGPRRWRALIPLCAAQLMVVLHASIVNVALPSIKTALHFSESSLSRVVNAYTLTFGGFLLLGGRAADLLGRRRVLADVRHDLFIGVSRTDLSGSFAWFCSRAPCSSAVRSGSASRVSGSGDR